ncbi:MAG: hypothetical protein CM15mP103_06950 [Gammaproteobacteria bacterium]|nr:MAG: hypothetical protein CM15mP103_06950 [Gammaproteobacteria bacterium]
MAARSPQSVARRRRGTFELRAAQPLALDPRMPLSGSKGLALAALGIVLLYFHAVVLERQLHHAAAVIAHTIDRASRADAVQGLTSPFEKTPAPAFAIFAPPLEALWETPDGGDVPRGPGFFLWGPRIQRALGGGGVKNWALFQ